LAKCRENFTATLLIASHSLKENVATEQSSVLSPCNSPETYSSVGMVMKDEGFSEKLFQNYNPTERVNYPELQYFSMKFTRKW
jgi:hypothetical protein